MKEKWEIALEKFLKKWKENKDVSGIIVCGSYITGNPTKNSDVDIQIILKRGCEWRERGNKIVDGILMEYFANPPERIIGYLEDDEKRRRKIEAHMLTSGKVILDKDGEVEKLKEIAKEYLKKKFKKMSVASIEICKYHLWDMTDNLEEVYSRNLGDFLYVYYNFLREVLNIYTEFLRHPEYNEHKALRFLSDKKDQQKYNIPELADRAFTNIFISAMKEKNDKQRLDIFIKLVKHVQNKMGGFNIDGWKLRSSLEVKK
jgi:predicted nucleotidyltransferase